MKKATLAWMVLLAACAVTPETSAPESVAPHTALAADANVSRVAAEQPSGSYVLDPRHTSVHWRIRHWGLSPYTGRFDAVTGALNFNAADPAQSNLSVRIPVNSVSTGLLNRASERAFDREIGAWMGGEANPEIVFESASIELIDATHGRIHGRLTLNGQTHPMTIDAEFQGGRTIPTNNRRAIAFTGRAIIERSTWISARLNNSDSPGEQVEIMISAEFLLSQ